MASFITSIGSEAAPHKIQQKQIFKFMARSLNLNETERKELEVLYRASGIQSRHSIINDYDKEADEYSYYPKNDLLKPFPTTASRMKLYERTATSLMSKAIHNCLSKRPEIQPKDFTHLITVSCTGMFAPGPDIQLVSQLGLRKNIKRTAINFMGCYAAFNAIKAANAFCRADAEAKVLVVCAEFCSIHLQKSTEPDHLLSAALFGDGAAALIVESHPQKGLSLKIEAEHCDLYPEGNKEMAWHIGDFGFEMKLSSYIPDLIEKGIGPLTDSLFKELNCTLQDIKHFAIHPGGKRILDVVEKTLDIPREKNNAAREILRDFGNMSSPTILFVIEKIMNDLSAENKGDLLLAFAFGPGLTLESLLFKIS